MTEVNRAERMARLGEMAAAIIHEINNPLSIINSSVESLIEGIPSRADEGCLLKNAEKIGEMVQRISKIMSSLRSFACDEEAGPYLRTDLKCLLLEALELRRMASGVGRVKVELELSQDAVYIDCHPVEISQVILNLLNNSFEATETSENPWIRLRLRRENDWSVLEVIDCGLGIPESIQRKIMQPFFTSKKSSRGMGLGLSLSRRIVTNHGGSLDVDAARINTCFVMMLPLSKLSSVR